MNHLFLLLMGMILEIIPNVVLLSPILAPLAVALGVDPIHFALILLVNLNIGTQIITLFLITYLPATTLWLPRLFGF